MPSVNAQTTNEIYPHFIDLPRRENCGDSKVETTDDYIVLLMVVEIWHLAARQLSPLWNF